MIPHPGASVKRVGRSVRFWLCSVPVFDYFPPGLHEPDGSAIDVKGYHASGSCPPLGGPAYRLLEFVPGRAHIKL